METFWTLAGLQVLHLPEVKRQPHMSLHANNLPCLKTQTFFCRLASQDLASYQDLDVFVCVNTDGVKQRKTKGPGWAIGGPAPTWIGVTQ